MENQSICNKICNIQISRHNFDPARLLSILLLHNLNSSRWAAIFSQKATTIVYLAFCIHPSSMNNRKEKTLTKSNAATGTFLYLLKESSPELVLGIRVHEDEFSVPNIVYQLFP